MNYRVEMPKKSYVPSILDIILTIQKLRMVKNGEQWYIIFADFPSGKQKSWKKKWYVPGISDIILNYKKKKETKKGTNYA